MEETTQKQSNWILFTKLNPPLILAFSGGGTRAAALAYGVLEELRDTNIVIDGKPQRLLDETDVVSSVSGGSFTAACYALYGNRIFDDFEDVFLRRNVQHQLVRGLLNPLEWFSSSGRTEMAVKLYENEVFHGATFDDMKRAGSPLTLGLGFLADFLSSTVLELANDPYRGLAWEVRTRYGYGKSPHAFAEFLWANFFRIRIIIDNWTLKDKIRGSDILIGNLPDDQQKDIIDEAMQLARSPEAAGMPGYLGSG